MLRHAIPVVPGMVRALIFDSNEPREGQQAHNSSKHVLGASQIKDITLWLQEVNINCCTPCGIQRRHNIVTLFLNVKCPLRHTNTPYTTTFRPKRCDFCPNKALGHPLGSSGQTITTNVSMTQCDWQICHQTHVLCGCTIFGTE